METLSHLAGGIAHEHNNLLGVVSGALEILRQSDAGPGRRVLISQAQAATRRNTGLTRQLLMLSQQAHLSPENLRLPAFLQEIQDLLSRLLPEDPRLHMRNPAGDQAFCADGAALQAVLINLALNAPEAMGPGGVLDLECSLLDCPRARPLLTGRLMPGPYLLFKMKDTGCRLPQDLLGRVLEPFFTTKSPGDGPGLGLSMAAGFARQSGGALDIDSRQGEGTEVTLHLPLRTPEPASEEHSAESPPTTPPERPPIPARSSWPTPMPGAAFCWSRTKPCCARSSRAICAALAMCCAPAKPTIRRWIRSRPGSAPMWC